MESKFKVGDVVNLIDNPSMYYVVTESILIDNDIFRRYQYEVSDIRTDDTFVYDESSLELQYHDSNLEEYFTEGNRQYSLPAWHGEYYNPYALYQDPIDLRTEKNEKLVAEYDNDTLPACRMAHILRDHSVYSRIQAMLVNSGTDYKKSNVDKMVNDLNLQDELELKKLYGDVRRKIMEVNEDPATTIANSKIIVQFTEPELRFVKLLDEIDPKDHWPVNMSNIMIMDAIRDAYDNAIKDGNRQYSSSGSKTSDKPAAPNKGKMQYKGTSTRHGLIIQFRYNFDFDIIETAYPIRTNNNSKKH